MKSRGKACLPRAVWLRGSRGSHLGGLDTPAFGSQVSLGPGHYPWATAISKVSMVASPSAKDQGNQHNRRGQMQWLGRRVEKSWVVQALEIPEKCRKTQGVERQTNKHTISIKPWVCYQKPFSFFCFQHCQPQTHFGGDKKTSLFSFDNENEKARLIDYKDP